MTDFFISYNKVDRAWAEWIAWELEAADYTTVIQTWDFRAGTNFASEMHKASREAKHTLAVLSPDYLTSEFCESEWTAAVFQDPTSKKARLLPVRVRSCDVEGLLGVIVYIDLVDLNETAAHDALLAGVRRERGKPSKRPIFPAAASVEGSGAPSFPGDQPTVEATPSWARMVRDIVQDLTMQDVPGVALLEPLRFGARRIIGQVIDRLRETGRPELVVRLVPKPNTGDEERLYGALYRDLKRGLEAELGRPLPPEWASCLEIGTDERFPRIDEDGFECVLENLLAGPIIDGDRTLVLVIEELSRIADEKLRNWANLMSRLTVDSPLKLLVWGGRDLYELCTGYRHLQHSSPFARLKRRDLGPLSADEVWQQVTDRCGGVAGADLLYGLTHGHPALVDELLVKAPAELREKNENGLQARALLSDHLQVLRHELEGDAEARAVLQRLLKGDSKRHLSEAETRLYWLGVLREAGADAWCWTAPVLEDWANGAPEGLADADPGDPVSAGLRSSRQPAPNLESAARRSAWFAR